VQRLGQFLVPIGVAGLVGAALQSWLGQTDKGGSIAAVGLFLVILGLVFLYPKMLEDDTHATSTMRVAVLMIVSLFVILTIKAGWVAPDLEHLKVQDSWAWVLAAALGGKAFQSFAENTPADSAAKATKGISGRGVGTTGAKRDENEGIEDTP